jgi:flavin-dependent dehydrogenase
MQKTISRIVIVGGGTAGWITASLVAARHRLSSDRDLDIVLIESPDIPTIGVGEGTWPSMRQTLQKIGIPEADLVRGCDASFKQGTRFIDWANIEGDRGYIHPFSFPAEYSNLNLAGYWLSQASDIPFADFVTPQSSVIAAGRAPKQPATPEYAFNVNYGYHFDAGRFAELLREHAVGKLGVRHLRANVAHIESADDGDIAAVSLETGERVEGDLFVDCTGQRGVLIHGHFNVDFVSVKDVLFNDSAIAVQVPYGKPDDAIASTTLATAVENGWIWDIGLQSRRGIGHVYSTAHSDGAKAMATLRDYVARTSPGIDLDELQFRSIPFDPGYRRKFWVRNVVAVGLSGGFIEPLEASALALIEQSATIISQQLPMNRDIMDVVAKRFNDRMHYNWQRVIEFLKLHYVISARNDSDYWQDCRTNASCPQELRDKLTLWQQQPPWHDDAPRVDELFPSASFQYVLYGMGFRPEYNYLSAAELERERPRVEHLVHENVEKARQMTRLLPTNRELINSMTSLRGVA